MKVVEKTEAMKMFVGGQWVDSRSGETFDATSPASGEVIATIPKGNREDAERAVKEAYRDTVAEIRKLWDEQLRDEHLKHYRTPPEPDRPKSNLKKSDA